MQVRSNDFWVCVLTKGIHILKNCNILQIKNLLIYTVHTLYFLLPIT